MDPILNFTCSITVCKEKFDDLRGLLKHLKNHIQEGLTVTCPVEKCSKSYRIVSSLTSHISRYHKLTDHSAALVMNASAGMSSERSFDESENVVNDDILYSNSPSSLDELSIFLLSLRYKHLIPASTVNGISSDIGKLLKNKENLVLKNVTSILNKEHVADHTIKKVIDTISSTFNCNLFSDGELRSDYSRNQLFERELPYVKPVSYQLSRNVTESRRNICFQYVPILQTLERLLSHEEVIAQVFSPITDICNDFTCVRGYKDGILFKTNKLFSSTNHSLQLMLYQDAFEVVNPLGSAKTVHKLLAVYYVLGNLHPYNRSRVNSMQLVLLCEERHVNQTNMDVLVQPLLDDLHVLETEGVAINGCQNICGSVCAIIGDNLGSNWLGGYITNFSTGDYNCRYCVARKSDFSTNSRTSRPLRTVDMYNACVRSRENSNQTHVQGIKFSSPFNSLLYYHVCNPGLPPCIAHDLFEGVVSYDMMLFVKYFIQHGWFSENGLNSAMIQFCYDELSRNSKCVI